LDVIIVGARCAGSPLAIQLARAGLRVCLVDRAGFPSDTPSTHAIQPIGVEILDRLGVLDSLRKVAPTIERGRVVLDGTRIEVDRLSDLVGAPMMSARRVTLDAILLDAASEAGAEVRTGTTVTGLVEERGRVCGVTTTNGELRAPLVVGADGARSTIARLVGAREFHRTAPGRIFLWAYLEEVDPANDGLWLGKTADYGYLATPTDDGLFMVAVVPDIDRRDEVRAGRQAVFDAGLPQWPELHASLEGARRVGPVQMMSRWHGFFRESAGPGWALVGDAGHFKDPTPGQGISDALRQSVELARAIERGGDDALRDWWSWRDRDAWEMYWFAHDLGASGPTPLVFREIIRRAAADPALIRGMMGVLNHDVAPSQVFRPALALRSVAGALNRWPGARRQVLRETRAIARNRVRRAAPRTRRKVRR
jgi:2-polyprenyl-6-methoxyphenol hydroxylase-like FAD-dependent oxidoreductase